MSETKRDWRWLPLWAPTFAVLVALLAAVVPAAFYLGGGLARLDQGVADLKAGQARLESLFDELREELRADLRENRAAMSEVQASVADVRERVSALEAGQG